MKPGEISKPFKTPTGWAIIKVTEFVKKQAIPLEEGIKRASARLEATETSKSFDTLMKGLRERTRLWSTRTKSNSFRRKLRRRRRRQESAIVSQTFLTRDHSDDVRRPGRPGLCCLKSYREQ